MSEAVRSRILRLVRRARARLEIVRLLRGAARGALAGSALALLASVGMKLLPAWPETPAVIWALLLGGTLAGATEALMRGRIGLTAAALYLDDRLDTRQRIVTLLTCPDGPFVDRVAAELVAEERLPGLPFPREAALVPAALFLVFAAGQLPSIGTESPAPVVIARSEPAPAGAPERRPIRTVDTDLVERLARGEAPTATEAEELKRSLEERLHRPEERRNARRDLAKAAQGDGDAARRVARTLSGEGVAGAGAPDEAGTGPSAAVAAHGPRGGLLIAAAYPESKEYLREYRNLLDREDSK